MRSIVSYLTTSDLTLKLYNAYKIRVTTDGGVNYMPSSCMINKIQILNV